MIMHWSTDGLVVELLRNISRSTEHIGGRINVKLIQVGQEFVLLIGQMQIQVFIVPDGSSDILALSCTGKLLIKPLTIHSAWSIL